MTPEPTNAHPLDTTDFWTDLEPGQALSLEPFDRPVVLRPAKSPYVQTQVVEILSPTLQRLWEEPDRYDAADYLLDGRRGAGPLVERLSEDADHLLITFLYRGDEDTRSVVVYGGPKPGTRSLSRFGRTNLWFLSEFSPIEARYAYIFEEEQFSRDIRSEVIVKVIDLLDDLNPNHTVNGMSMLVLPASPAEGARRPRLPYSAKGSLYSHSVVTRHLRGRRHYSVYVPASGPTPQKSIAIAIFLDGEAFASGWPSLDTGAFVPTPDILDFLIAEGTIPPLYAVFVEVGNTRHEDLIGNPAYADFIADELLPSLRATYPGISMDPRHVIIAGSSFGGLCAAFCGLQRPDALGNVLSMSGSFWVDVQGDIRDQSEVREGLVQSGFVSRPKLPLRFHIEVGRFEDTDLLILPNRQLRDILIAKGYDVSFHQFLGNHDYMCWRDSVVRGLRRLTANW